MKNLLTTIYILHFLSAFIIILTFDLSAIQKL